MFPYRELDPIQRVTSKYMYKDHRSHGTEYRLEHLQRSTKQTKNYNSILNLYLWKVEEEEGGGGGMKGS